jgi:hypothetical protein
MEIQFASLSRSLEPLSSGDALQMSMSSQSHPISRRIADTPPRLLAGPENKWRALRAEFRTFTVSGVVSAVSAPLSRWLPGGAWRHFPSLAFPFLLSLPFPLPLPFVFPSLPFFPLPGQAVNTCPGSPQLLQACALDDGHGSWQLPEL